MSDPEKMGACVDCGTTDEVSDAWVGTLWTPRCEPCYMALGFWDEETGAALQKAKPRPRIPPIGG